MGYLLTQIEKNIYKLNKSKNRRELFMGLYMLSKSLQTDACPGSPAFHTQPLKNMEKRYVSLPREAT